MPEAGDDADYADRIAATADAKRDAWQRTIDEMRAIAEELDADGWAVTTAGADHTAPEPPDAGPEGRYGLVHVVPGNVAEDVRDALSRAAGEDALDASEGAGRELDAFGRYEVFRKEVGNDVFQVTVLFDDDTETALLLAGSYELTYVEGLLRAAVERDAVYTHVQTLDGTTVASFRHEDPSLFFPNAEARVGGDREGDGGGGPE
jgi:hypothetical protein